MNCGPKIRTMLEHLSTKYLQGSLQFSLQSKSGYLLTVLLRQKMLITNKSIHLSKALFQYPRYQTKILQNKTCNVDVSII